MQTTHHTDSQHTPRPIDNTLHDASIQTLMQVHIHRQRALGSLARALSSRFELSEMLALVRDGVVEAGGVDRSQIFLYDASTGLLQSIRGSEEQGCPAELYPQIDNRDMIAGKPLHQVVSGSIPYYLTNAYGEENGLPPDDPMSAVKHHATLPLWADGKVVGILCVDNLLTGRPITEEDVELLLPFAYQAGIAINHDQMREEIREAQDALIRSEKLRAVGELASGVAHNVNNVLSAVLGYAELIQEATGATAEICHYARTIERAALDGAEIVRRIQHFARRENAERAAPLLVADVIQEAIDLTRPAWHNQATGRGAKIEVETELDITLRIQGIASEIREVLVNLIKNAVDAMPQGGTLAIRCGKEGNQGIIAVSDTGNGMDADTCRRVFEPFYSTKGAGLGTGLGLSVAWGIVDRHQGRIEVQSVPAQGTRFLVHLPLAKEADAAPTQESPQAEGLQNVRLLLVEDEELVGGGLARSLSSRGAQVVLFDNAPEALQWLESHADSCDLILSDHGMTGMTGMELLEEARTRFPHVKRVLLSGWGDHLPGVETTSAAHRMLTKPILLEDLMRALQETLVS